MSLRHRSSPAGALAVLSATALLAAACAPASTNGAGGTAAPAERAGAVEDGLVPEAPSEALEVVRAQVAAFNRHDVGAMAELVADDFTWLRVEGDSVVVELRGREAFSEGMRSYFDALPDVRSTLEGTVVDGSFVSFRERVTWTASNGAGRISAALGVYEVRDGRIRRAWYYPAGS